MIASTSSVWPLPSTPATPTISPACTANETSSSGRWETTSRSGGASSVSNATSDTLNAAAGPSSGARAPLSMVSPTTSNNTFCCTVRSRVSGDGSSLPTIISASCREVTVLGSGTSPTVRPARITVIASACSSTSSSLCEMNTTVEPCCVRLRSEPNSSLTSWGTRTAVGSSRMRMPAPRYSTLRISTRCLSPTPSS